MLKSVFIIIGFIGQVTISAALVREVETILLFLRSELHYDVRLLLITASFILQVMHSEYGIPRIPKIASFHQIPIMFIYSS